MMKQAELIVGLIDHYAYDLIAAGVLVFWNVAAAFAIYGLAYAAVWMLSGGGE